jgi:hypothetical protein
VAKLLNSLVGLYKYQGRYAEAEPLYNRALAIREKALGPDHVAAQLVAPWAHPQTRCSIRRITDNSPCR